MTGDECHCNDWHGCIMAQSIVGTDNIQPYKFSECSLSDYIESLRVGHGICLFNPPNQVTLNDSEWPPWSACHAVTQRFAGSTAAASWRT